MTNTIRGISVIFILAVFAPGILAAEGGTKFFAELEMFMPGQVADGEEADLKNTARAFVAGGSNSAAYTIEAAPAAGGRVGLLYPIQDIGDMGLSIGYLAGPSLDVKFVDNDPGIGISNFDYTRDLSFVRALGEFRKEYQMADNWTFYPAFGVGMAFGSNKGKVARATNYFAGDTVESKSWSGVTWEATAGFAYKMEKTDLNFAVRYAGFPQFKEDAAKSLSKIDWSTIGFSIGLTFGTGGGSSYSDKAYRPTARTEEYDQDDTSMDVPVAATEPVAAETDDAEGYEGHIEYAEDYFSQGNYEKALGEYSSAMKALPENDERIISVLERKGMVFTKQKNYQRAKGAYASAINVSKNIGANPPAVVNSYLGLAYALEKSGNTASAIKNYERALQLTTTPATKEKVRRILQRLKRKN